MKPHVICHMVSPLDGRLMVAPWAPDGSPLKQATHAEFEAGAQGLGTAGRLELLSAEPVAAGAVHLRYRVVHD